MNKKRFLSAMLALSMLPAAYSCGKTDSSSQGGNALIVDPTADPNSSEGDEEYANESSDSYHSIVNGQSPKKATTTKKTDNKKTTETTAKSSSSSTSSNTVTSSGSNSNRGRSSSGSNSGYNNRSNSNNNHSGSNSSTGNKTTTNTPSTTTPQSHTNPTTTTQAVTAPPTTTPPATEPPNEEKEYTAIIDLNGKPSFTGSNVTIKGSKVIITAGGDYHLSGFTFGGQVCVDTVSEEPVTLVLDGVDIHSTSGPAIFVNEAKKCTIKVREGTVNSLSDNTKDKINDGVIFSNDTLRFKGNGTLNIDAGNAHGIASDDDIIFENGTYNINAVKSGLLAHDDITINGGTLNINGGTNGMKSKGTININGGNTTVCGGTKEEKSSIYAESYFCYNDGYVFAAGNMVSSPTSSTKPYIIADLGESIDGESTVEMYLNGKQMKKFQPNNNFRCLMMLAPEIASGNTFYTIINGNKSAVQNVGNGQNLFSLK